MSDIRSTSPTRFLVSGDHIRMVGKKQSVGNFPRQPGTLLRASLRARFGVLLRAALPCPGAQHRGSHAPAVVERAVTSLLTCSSSRNRPSGCSRGRSSRFKCSRTSLNRASLSSAFRCWPQLHSNARITPRSLSPQPAVNAQHITA